MFCSKCGIELPDNAIVCYQCATPTQKGASLKNSAQNSNKRASDLIKFLAMVIVVAVTIGIAIFVANNLSSIKNSSSSPHNDETISQTPDYNSSVIEKSNPDTKIKVREQPQQVEIPPTPSKKEVVIDKTFFVNARSFQSFSITLNRDAHLTGRFSAQGGKNDIDCLVVDEDNFINFQNQTNFRIFYQSNYVSVGRVDLRLAAGNYHIIFNNRAAILTNKTVTANFEVE